MESASPLREELPQDRLMFIKFGIHSRGIFLLICRALPFVPCLFSCLICYFIAN